VSRGLATADYAILVGYFAVLLGVGFFYAGRMQNIRDFFSGGRQVPWWLAGISLYMTTFSAFTFVSYSALTYERGVVSVVIWWFSIPGCLLSAWFLASRWRRAATTSPVEYLETRFSPLLRQCFSWFGIPLLVLDDALKLFVIGGMVAVAIGAEGNSDVLWSIAICGLIMLSYTFMGGLWAVLITDFIQFLIVGIAVIVLLPLAWHRAGGAGPISANLPKGFANITAGQYTWPWLLSFAVILALAFATKWTYVQRYYSARSDREARWVGYLVAFLTLFTMPLLFFPALAARVFLPNVANPNQVYSLLCQELLPVGMMGMMLAAMFSATMSHLSADYNSLASVITNDIIKRVFMRNASDRALVIVARLSTLAVGLLAMVLALIFANAKGLEDLVQYMAQLFAALLPPVALPMAAGLLSRHTSNGGALSGFVLGAVCGTAAYIASYTGDQLAFLRSVQYLTWITVVPTALGLVAGTFLFPNSQAKRETIALFLDGLKSQPREKASLTEGDAAAVALCIIGITMALLGIILMAGILATVTLHEGRLSLIVGAIICVGGMITTWTSYAMMKRTEN